MNLLPLLVFVSAAGHALEDERHVAVVVEVGLLQVGHLLLGVAVLRLEVLDVRQRDLLQKDEKKRGELGQFRGLVFGSLP